jgi:hypothetical protein
MAGQRPADPAQVDGLELLAQLRREARNYPKATVLVELATLGPVLNLLVGGRTGVPRHRDSIDRDEATFIPLYRATLERLLANVAGHAGWMRLVDRAIAHDHQENTHLLKAFDLLDPPDAAAPRVMAATRHAAPAAGHAIAKFALLAPAVAPAAGVAGWRGTQRLATGRRTTTGRQP